MFQTTNQSSLFLLPGSSQCTYLVGRLGQIGRHHFFRLRNHAYIFVNLQAWFPAHGCSKCERLHTYLGDFTYSHIFAYRIFGLTCPKTLKTIRLIPGMFYSKCKCCVWSTCEDSKRVSSPVTCILKKNPTDVLTIISSLCVSSIQYTCKCICIHICIIIFTYVYTYAIMYTQNHEYIICMSVYMQ